MKILLACKRSNFHKLRTLNSIKKNGDYLTLLKKVSNNAIQKMENHTKDHSGTCKPKIVGNFAVQKPSALNIQEK